LIQWRDLILSDQESINRRSDNSRAYYDRLTGEKHLSALTENLRAKEQRNFIEATSPFSFYGSTAPFSD